MAILAILLLLLYIKVYNHKVPEFISKQAKKEFGVDMGYHDFNFDPINNFPMFQYSINCIFIDGSSENNFGNNFLEIEQCSFLLNPLDLFKKIKRVEAIEIKDAHVHVLVDSLGNKNLIFLKTLMDKASKKNNESNELTKNDSKVILSSFQIQNMHFEFEDKKMEKLYDIHFHDARIDPFENNGFQFFKLESNCFFNGLTFKKEDGPFLKNKSAFLRVDACFKKDSILFQESTLLIGNDQLSLQGYLLKSEPNYLNLNIESPGILYEDAMELLPIKVQNNLAEFHIDQPAYANVSIEGELKPYHPPKVVVDFSAYGTDLKFENEQLKNVNFQAKFINNCKSTTKKILPDDACLEIKSFEGKLKNNENVILSGIVHDLNDLSAVDLKGEIQTNLNNLSPKNEKIENLNFTKGKLNLFFDFKGNPNQLKELSSHDLIKFTTVVSDAELTFDGLLFQNINANIHHNKGFSEIEKLKFYHNGSNYRINGKLNKFLAFLENKTKLGIDLALQIDNFNLDNSLSFDTKLSSYTQDEKNISNKLINSFQKLNGFGTGQVKVMLSNAKFKTFNLKDTEFLVTTNESVIKIEKFNTIINESLELNLNLWIDKKNDYPVSIDYSCSGSFADFVQFYSSNKIIPKAGQLSINGSINTPLKILDELNDWKNLVYHQGDLKLNNGNIFLQKEKLTLKEVNTHLTFDKENLLIKSLKANHYNFDLSIGGKVKKYLAFTNKQDEDATVDLTLHFNKISVLDQNEDKDDFKDYQMANTFKPKSILNSIQEVWGRANGKIKVNIDHLELQKYPIKQIKFTADLNDFCPNAKTDEECLYIQKIDAFVFGHIPFQVNARVSNFEEPVLDLQMNASMPIEDLSKLMYNDNFDPRGGDVDLALDYSYKVRDELSFNDQIKNADIKGIVKLNSVNLHYPYRGFDLYALDGLISFDNKTIDIEELFMDLNKNPMIIDGTCYDCIPFLLNEDVPFNLEMDLSCSHFDFAKFYTPASLAKKENVVVLDSVENINTIDKILAEGRMIINANIDSLVYNKFLATEVSGYASLDDQIVELDHVEMILGEGDFEFNGSIRDLDINAPKIELEAKIANLKTDHLLYAFDNFNQDKVTNETLKGIMNAKIHFEADFDKDYKALKESIYGDLSLELMHGELIDFGPLKNLKGILFKKRRLDNVYFEKLNTKLAIRGQDVLIDRFNLNATAITLGIEGVYTFSNEDRTKILMEIPISNLFKRFIDRKELIEHKKSRGGKTILIDLYEENKKLKFRLHKVAKKNKKRRFKLFKRAN